VLIILAVSLLGIGIGQTAIATLGIPYIDDNVKSKQSPLYMAITIGVRILGPAIGYYLGSLCMRISYDLTISKSHTDSNFIGAWYLGE
jgi:MFS family permease